MKVAYEDLSGWLKVAVIISWIIGVLYIGAFIFGFLTGLS